MERETLYIIDPRKTFRGAVQNTMTAPAGKTPKYVDYTADENNGVNMTFKQYKDHKQNPHLKALDFETFYNDIWKPYLEDTKTDWTPITEEKFEEMLECLPPVRWTRFARGSFFFISEPLTANLHSCYIQYKDKNYTSVRDVHESKESILKSFHAIATS